MYIYIQTEPQLWTVGFYAPDGTWHTDSDHSSKTSARDRTHYLNGGCEVSVIETNLEGVCKLVQKLEQRVADLEAHDKTPTGSYADYRDRYPQTSRNQEGY